MECRVTKALSNMTEGNKCTPWYYPPVNPDTRLCSPFEAEDFIRIMELISVNECRVWVSILKLWYYMIMVKWNISALFAQLRRDPLLSECVSCQVPGLQLKEYWNKPDVQTTPQCNWKRAEPWWYSHVGNQCDGWLQATNIIKLIKIYESIRSQFWQQTFHPFRSVNQGVPTYVSDQVTDNRRRFPYSPKVPQKCFIWLGLIACHQLSGQGSSSYRNHRGHLWLIRTWHCICHFLF